MPTKRLLIVLMLLLQCVPLIAQEEVAGRSVTLEDWGARIPIVLISIVIVIVVDAYFILPILRGSKNDN